MASVASRETILIIPKVSVPEGASGQWAVQKFSVSREEAQWANLRNTISGGGMRGRGISPGEYTRLMHGSTVVMSDVPAEMRDHIDAVLNAKGDCLVNGLGLGMVVQAMLFKNEVNSVTVIEKSPDVIKLVAPHYQERFGKRFTVIESDALQYVPPRGMKYGAVWHDIWNDICSDNLEAMRTLHRRYGKRAEWQGSWCRAECQRPGR